MSLLTLLSSCSKFSFGSLIMAGNNSGGGGNPGIVLSTIVQKGPVEQALTFTPPAGMDIGTFTNFTFTCEFKVTENDSASTCTQYGDHSPSIDSVNEKLLWNISNTPKGIYTFTVQKNFTNGNIPFVFSLKIQIGEPFVSKWLLNPDKVFKMNLDPQYTYNFIVNWGDGSAPEQITTAGLVSHTYVNGEIQATITIHGELPGLKIVTADPTDRPGLINAYAAYATSLGMPLTYAEVDAMVISYTTPQLHALLVAAGVPMGTPAFNSKLLEISNLGDVGWLNMDNLFSGQSTLTKVAGGDLSKVISMKGTFNGTGTVEFDTSTWNLINLETADLLFKGVTFAPASNLSGMKFSSKLTSASSMFYQAKGDFTSASIFNFSGLTNMESAFEYADLTNLNTTNWNTQNVANFKKTFRQFKCVDCNFSGIKISNKTNNTSSMFEDYKGTSIINMISVDMSEVTDSSSMFRNMNFIRVSDANLFKVLGKNKNASLMFYYAENLILDTNDWNTINVENWQEVFAKVDMNLIDTSGVVVTAKALNMRDMFNSATNLELNTNRPGKEWNTSSVTDMSGVFNSTVFKPLPVSDISRVIPTANTTNLGAAFLAKFRYIPATNSWTEDISNMPPIDTSLWNTTNITNFTGAFSYRDMTGSNLSGLVVSNKATRLERMFEKTVGLTLNTASWDISNVTNFNQMFERAELLNVNFSGFKPSSKLTTAYWPFREAKNLTLNTAGWDISGLTNAQDFFSQVDLSNVNLAGFNPGPAMTNLSGAFYATKNITINTENWNLSPTVSMSSLFAGVSNTTIYLKNFTFPAAPANYSDIFGWGGMERAEI